jgi:hypothetical protein
MYDGLPVMLSKRKWERYAPTVNFIPFLHYLQYKQPQKTNYGYSETNFLLP